MPLPLRFYLASTSPARLMVLRAAGIEPWLITPEVDEDAALSAHEQQEGRSLSTEELVLFLARTKAEAAYRKLAASGGEIRGLIFGGDSSFELEGQSYGKPHTAEAATERIKQQRGKTGVLYSGHWVIDATGEHAAEPRSIGATASATVTMSSEFSDAEVADYVASGEPLAVAGAFTIDSLGSAYIEHISGDPSTVIGLSVPTLRSLVKKLGYNWADFWNRQK